MTILLPDSSFAASNYRAPMTRILRQQNDVILMMVDSMCLLVVINTM